jgi:uncharacterized phage protein (TIGR01671 family)
MKREIKFRAWVYHYILDKYQMRDFESIKNFCGAFFFEPEKYTPNPHVLMQFTGLTDKNRKEIYEGDIICNDKYRTWEWRGVVKFSHGVFGAEWFSNIKSQSMVGSFGQKHNLRTLDDDILESQVIIGNIYENPELL